MQENQQNRATNFAPQQPIQQVATIQPQQDSPQIQQPQQVQPPAPKKGGVLKKVGLVGVVLILVLILVFVTLRFVLPRLRGSVLPERKISLVWWGLNSKESVLPLIVEYNSENPNVSVDYVEQSPTDYRERLTSSLARREAVDIFEIHNSWTPMFASQLSFVPSDVMTQADFAQAFYPVFSDTLTIGNGIVGIPLTYDGLVLYISDDIFSTYGKTPPSTWDDFVSVARALTLKDEAGTIRQAGAAMGETSNVSYWPEILGLLLIQNGASLNKPEGVLAEGALNFYTDFSTKYKVWDSTMPESMKAFSSGQLAMYFGLQGDAKKIKALNPSVKFRIVKVPQILKENADEPDVTYASSWVEVVNNQSKEETEAWKFLKFISQKEVLSKMKTDVSFSRRDMETNKDLLAGDAKAWYLAGDTNDGDTGINSQINKIFSDAIDAMVVQGVKADKALAPVADGVSKILASYNIIVK